MIRHFALWVLALCALFAVPTVRAEIECEVPMVDWRPKADLVMMAREQGWQVERMRTDDGCYLVYATDRAGHQIKAWIQPMTLEVLAEKRQGDDGVSEDGDD